ncbi:MAG: DUF4271 domain-containing protein [Bacteroidota bacterium]
MPDNTTPYNPNILPAEGRSTFKLFVLSQDEVPQSFAYTGTGFAGNIKDKAPSALVIQTKYAPAMVHTSVFAKHPLKPKALGPQTIAVRNYDWILGLFIICFALIAMVRGLYFRRFSQVFKAFYNPRFTNQLMREGTLFNERLTPPLLIAYLVTLSLLAYRGAQNITGWQFPPSASYLILFKIFVLICVFFLFRIIIIRLGSFIFKTHKETSEYLVNTLVVSEVSVMFILPLTACAFYFAHYAADAALYFCFGLVGLMLLYRIIRGFISGLSFSGYSLYYLILYLCTVEILPFFVVGKFALNYLKSPVL